MSMYNLVSSVKKVLKYKYIYLSFGVEIFVVMFLFRPNVANVYYLQMELQEDNQRWCIHCPQLKALL